MPFEELLRYTLPGYVTLVPVVLGFWLYSFVDPSINKDSWTPLIAVVILVGPAIGFLVQQLHMLIHECSGYADPKRRNLALIIRKFREEKSNLSNNSPEKRWADERQHILGSEALLAWDYFLHSEHIEGDIRAHIIRTWYFIHSFRGIAWSFGIGFVSIGIIGVVTTTRFSQSMTPVAATVIVVLASFYLLAPVFLLFKSYMTEQFLWPYEELAVVDYWEHIKAYLEAILKSREKREITCYSFRGMK